MVQPVKPANGADPWRQHTGTADTAPPPRGYGGPVPQHSMSSKAIFFSFFSISLFILKLHQTIWFSL